MTPSLLGWALCCVLAGWPGATPAAPGAAALIAEAEARGLHADPDWLRLTYFEAPEGRSEVRTPDFFLASGGQESAAAELRATLEGWFSTAPDRENPRCRFPARYLWLATRLQLPPAATPRCELFERWARLDELRSVSLLMVAGYLGNPASSFGHTLLTLDYHRPEEGGRLLDTAFSFGANIPDDEPMLRYIYRGLTGGYQAGYANKLYYGRDRVYTRKQFRDIWQYRLALDAREQEFLVAHLWEISGQGFTYYFLTKNCAYRMAQLLTLVTGEDHTEAVQAWYAPVELFHALESGRQAGEDRIAAITYIPSDQRTLQQAFTMLSSEEAATVNAIIRARGAGVEDRLAGIPAPRRARMLDVLIAYYEYKLAGLEDEEGPERPLQTIKDRMLRARLALPAGPPRGPSPGLAAPTTGHAPLRVGIGVQREAGGLGGLLRLTAYAEDLLDDPEVRSELVVGDVELGREAGVGDLALRRLDLIRLRRLQTQSVWIAGESRWSWQLRTGMSPPQPGASARGAASLGAGRAFALGDGVVGYAMLDAGLSDAEMRYSLEPNLGVVGRSGALAAELAIRQRCDLDSGSCRPRWQMDGRYRLRRNLEISLGAEREAGVSRARFGIDAYW